MNAVRHTVSSAVAGVAVGTATESPEMGTAFFLAGWTIDLDYIFDGNYPLTARKAGPIFKE